MSDDLKPNPSTEDTSIENKDAAEVAIDSTDHLADSAETDSFETAQPKTSSDTPESAEASVEAPDSDVSSTEEATLDDEESSVDEDKTSTATVSGIKSARAIPSITKTDTMVAAKSKSGDSRATRDYLGIQMACLAAPHCTKRRMAALVTKSIVQHGDTTVPEYFIAY